MTDLQHARAAAAARYAELGRVLLAEVGMTESQVEPRTRLSGHAQWLLGAPFIAAPGRPRRGGGSISSPTSADISPSGMGDQAGPNASPPIGRNMRPNTTPMPRFAGMAWPSPGA